MPRSPAGYSTVRFGVGIRIPFAVGVSFNPATPTTFAETLRQHLDHLYRGPHPSPFISVFDDKKLAHKRQKRLSTLGYTGVRLASINTESLEASYLFLTRGDITVSNLPIWWNDQGALFFSTADAQQYIANIGDIYSTSEWVALGFIPKEMVISTECEGEAPKTSTRTEMGHIPMAYAAHQSAREGITEGLSEKPTTKPSAESPKLTVTPVMKVDPDFQAVFRKLMSMIMANEAPAEVEQERTQTIIDVMKDSTGSPFAFQVVKLFVTDKTSSTEPRTDRIILDNVSTELQSLLDAYSGVDFRPRSESPDMDVVWCLANRLVHPASS